MEHTLDPTWNLESIFAGGSSSEEFAAFLSELEQSIETLEQMLEPLVSASDRARVRIKQDISNISKTVLQVQDVESRLREAAAFVECLNAQNVKDKRAAQLTGRISALAAKVTGAFTIFDNVIGHLSDEQLEELLAHPQMEELQFPLTERKQLASEKLPANEESLVASLSVDGYHAWGELYDTIAGRIQIDIDEDGQTVPLSVGQLANRLHTHDRAQREALFSTWENAWANEADLCAKALNHISGFRIRLYNARGWSSILKEPLTVNRMSEQTLQTMWSVIAANKQPFADFLKEKARLFGVEKPTWIDVEAPLPGSDTKFTYEEARTFIVRHFEQFSSDMAEFANRCFDQRWIEVEDRSGKRPGGFCTSFPINGGSRIFMTFSGTPSNVATLAHELGHAYHQHVMGDMPELLTNYAMNVAETASTFAEMIVADASVKEAKSKVEKLALLEDKVSRSIAMFMNIHARFLFETRFYEQRKTGTLTSEELNTLMTEAQQEAFAGALASAHPHFWAAKLHFYITDVPFYNFPYTFGYLFSTGIYARAAQEPTAFADKYVALLRDTGRMQVEDLAMKHLGVDLTDPDFWQSAMDVAIADANEFVVLAREV